MKSKLPYILLAAVAFGLLLYAPTLVRDRAEPEAPERPLWPGPISAATVQVETPTDSVQLERARARWLVNGRPADSAAVADLLAALEGVRVGPPVARGPRAHARLGVDYEARRVAVVTEDGRELAIRLGEAAPEGGHYVRREGEDEVFLLPSPVGELFERPPEAWRERRIATVDTAAVREVLIRHGPEEFTLRRVGDSWRVGEARADARRVGSLLATLAELWADGFPPPEVEAAADFESPHAILSVFVEEEGDVIGRNLAASLRFVRAASEEAPWLVRPADEPDAFVVSAETAGRLLPARAELVDG